MTAREVVVWEEAHSTTELIFCSLLMEGKKKDHYFYLHLELQMHGWSAGEE
jgi:hypothetical protein